MPSYISFFEGRVRAGHCWRLYSSAFHEGTGDHNLICGDHDIPESGIRMPTYSIPEMRRISMEAVLLQTLLLLSSGSSSNNSIGNKKIHPIAFLRSCIEAPSNMQLKVAVENLITFGAINATASGLILTPLGTIQL